MKFLTWLVVNYVLILGLVALSLVFVQTMMLEHAEDICNRHRRIVAKMSRIKIWLITASIIYVICAFSLMFRL